MVGKPSKRRRAKARAASFRASKARKEPRELTADEVTFTVEAEQEREPVRGNAMASGDDAADKEVEDAIIERLNSGDVWAWASVKVTARWKGFTGADYLGCCSYEDEASFVAPGGYYDDMKVRALEELNARIAETAGELSELEGEAP
jgi:hypothetical protein